MASAFLAAFREDLPLGITRVDELAGKTKSTGLRAMATLNPNSDEGKQFSRLLGADIPRRVLELHHGVSFGSTTAVRAWRHLPCTPLEMTLRKQIEAHHSKFVDC